VHSCVAAQGAAAWLVKGRVEREKRGGGEARGDVVRRRRVMVGSLMDRTGAPSSLPGEGSPGPGSVQAQP